MTSPLRIGDDVLIDFSDPDLPAGSTGTVERVHPDSADGVDVRLKDGRLINILAWSLIPR